MTKPPTIEPGSPVVLHFSLYLEDGTEVISTFGAEPLTFSLGDGTLEPMLESRLIGLQAGDERTLTLSGSEVYGAWDSANRHWIDAGAVPPSLTLSAGEVVAFTTPAGDEVAGTVERIEASRILFDFNHPLSGKRLVLHTTILAVESPE